MFCGVTEKFVTPNINMNNLNNEYVQYSKEASPGVGGGRIPSKKPKLAL